MSAEGWGAVRRCLVHERMRGSPSLRSLCAAADQGTLELRWSGSVSLYTPHLYLLTACAQLNADVIFPETKPALAFLVVAASDTRTVQQLLPALDKASACFRNCFCVLLCDEADRSSSYGLWTELNRRCPAGRLRLLRADDVAQLDHAMLSVFGAMANEEKFRKQKAYFEEVQRDLVSPGQAREVALDVTARIGVPHGDALIVTHALPSLGAIIGAVSGSAPSRLAESVPVDESSLQSIAAFFADEAAAEE